MFKNLIIISIIALISSCNEKLEEEITGRYPNGTPIKVNYFKWVGNDKIVVKEIRYYQNGEKEIEGEYKDEKKHGKWTYWYNNGKKWSEGTFKNDLSDGHFTIWYKSGRRNYEAEYKEGKPNGKWIFYDNDDVKYKEVIFDMGEKMEEKNL